MKPRLLVCDGAEAFRREAARELASLVAGAIAREGRCRLGLAGGRTPRPVYESLAAGCGLPPIDWDRVELFFGDERCVPPDDPESNFRMVRESLLDRLPRPPRAVLRMEGERCPEAAERYEARLPDRLDVLVLGMGADGHTASLFPGSPALHERRRRVLCVRAPVPPELRLTVTPPVIEAAREIVLLAAGRSKAEALARVMADEGRVERTPARIARRGLIVTDADAAALVPPSLVSRRRP